MREPDEPQRRANTRPRRRRPAALARREPQPGEVALQAKRLVIVAYTLLRGALDDRVAHTAGRCREPAEKRAFRGTDPRPIAHKSAQRARECRARAGWI